MMDGLASWDVFHRNDRVRLVTGLGAVGIVEGWKDGRVLVNWGTQQTIQGPVRCWHARFDLVLAGAEVVLP